MITFPCAKINLGLNVISKRPDGYHNIETIFYPIPLNDALEIKLMDDRFPSKQNCDLKVTGKGVDCNEEDNIVVKAYNLLSKDFVLPRIHAHLYKNIPSQAGLGGGSSDAAFMMESIPAQTHCASIFSFSSVRYIHRSVFSSRAASSSACLACNS